MPAPPGGLPLVDDVEDVDEDYEPGDLGNHGGLDWSTDDANEVVTSSRIFCNDFTLDVVVCKWTHIFHRLS